MGGIVEWLGLLDIVCINRYWGWYTQPGDIKAGAAMMLNKELDWLYQTLHKPIVITDFVTGMHVWAFADFKTTQGIICFGGMNYKGVFTRDRRPKMVAHMLRSRWPKQ